MQNTYIAWFEIFDTVNTVVTDCATWQLVRNCPRACLLASHLRLQPWLETEETTFNALLKEAMHAWHRAKLKGKAEPALALELSHGRRERCVSYNGINSYDLLLNYFLFDQEESLDWHGEAQVFRCDIVPCTEQLLDPPLVLSDRIDGLVAHEGDLYLLVHMPVKCLADQTQFFQTDFTNTLKAVFAGDALKLDLKGIAYNLLQTHAAPIPDRNERCGVGRQFLKFKPDYQAAVRVELGQLAVRYNELMGQPQSCITNKDFCFHNGRTCVYDALCQSNMSWDALQQYRYTDMNPHFSREEQEEILELNFFFTAPGSRSDKI